MVLNICIQEVQVLVLVQMLTQISTFTCDLLGLLRVCTVLRSYLVLLVVFVQLSKRLLH